LQHSEHSPQLRPGTNEIGLPAPLDIRPSLAPIELNRSGSFSGIRFETERLPDSRRLSRIDLIRGYWVKCAIMTLQHISICFNGSSFRFSTLDCCGKRPGQSPRPPGSQISWDNVDYTFPDSPDLSHAP
jgi:hypothetical protein